MVTGVPYPSESSGRLRPVPEWSKQSPASLAMGYELSVTPLQLAMAYAAFANGGELLEPTLVREIRDPDGTVRFTARRQVVRRMMSPATAATMRKLLRDVVTSGTGGRADLAGYGVAGKSGTARRMRDDGRGYEEGAYTASFVGFFPAEDPQLVILVKLDAPEGAFYGGEIAAPVTKAVLQAALAARDGALELKGGAPPTRVVTAEPSVAIEPRETVETTDAPVVYDLAAPIPAPRRVVISRPVPEVTGLSTRAAVRALHRAGFRVVIDATGAVGETSPAVGTMLPSGSVVRFAPSRGGTP
jgi:cell division protein FtsI (penicillin-binding protein 3)